MIKMSSIYNGTGNEKKVKSAAGDPEAAMQLYNDLVNSGQHDQAEELAREMEIKFTDNAAVQYYLGAIYDEEGKDAEADICFERALKAAPGNVDARRAVAIGSIQKNDLKRARDLLSFMQHPGPDQDAATLLYLASAFQKNGNYTEAHFYYQIIVRDFPGIAKKDVKFRQNVKKTEKNLRRPETILPRKEYDLKKVKTLAAVVVLSVIALLLINWYLSTQQTLHVVNELKAPATVSIPDHEPIVVSASERKTIKVLEGQYDVNVRVGDAAPQTVQMEISNNWFDRFFQNNVFILNVGRGAVILWEETLYSENPNPKARYSYRFYVGDPFIAINEVDYVFKKFPETISLSSGESTTKTRVGVLKLEPLAMLGVLQTKDTPPQKIISFLEPHLDFYRDDASLLRIYVQLNNICGSLDRCLKFLARDLSHRPILVEWHRMYQETRKLSGEGEKLFLQYDSMLEKEPGNASLLYLRGRIDPDPNQSFDYYNKAISADSKNPYPYFAKAYDLACRGDFIPAQKLGEAAYKLKTDSVQMMEMLFQLRLALGQYETLEKEVQAALARERLDLWYFRKLLEIRIAKKDKAGAQKALKEYEEAAKKATPNDPCQGELQNRMFLAYLQKDFDSYARDAVALKDVNARSKSLKIVYLNRGEMEKAEALPGIKESADGYECLLYWLGWLEKGGAEKASEWLNRAREKFLASSGEDKVVGQLLEKPGRRIANRLYDLVILPEYKRILYAAFARLYPNERRKLLAMARMMNYSLEFPHHFLSKIIK